ncbi:hypothetical protein [Dyadobacter jiangsuensis]|uniref:Uncharacterized protein n=1 Tax=Dyadobacter jiangsuensis TaxID=1591085 RepID=A0A2P8FP55_9BACT|nr:hypothetical protein [Dyadobacter jiangsuensis]PSL23473.1 hypothetical protein CLV60_11628 [Dyadobacter jiangsuensis]
MSFYGEMAELAKEQIEEFGRSVILRRNNQGDYDPATDSFSGGSSADVSVIALFTKFEQNEIDGTIILRDDKKVLIAASSLASPPQHNDILVDGDYEYKVLPLDIIRPGDTPLIYKLQVRK